jgi:hypothetical protein
MNTSNTVIVISTYKTPIPWADRLREMGFEVRVYTKENPNSPYNIPKNIGWGDSVWIKYSIDNYENPPEYSIMIHDHEYSYHQEGSIIDAICSQINSTKPYFNFNCVNTDGEFYLGETTEYIKWYDEFLGPYLGPLKQYGEFTLNQRMHSQFLIHRSLIQANPKKMYEDIYNWLITKDVTMYMSGYLLEIHWALIWRQIKPLTNLPKIAVYTELTPNNNSLDSEWPLKYTDEIFDFFCFTNEPIQSTRWKMIPKGQQQTQQELKEFFKDYTHILYINPALQGVRYDHIFTQLYQNNLTYANIRITLGYDGGKNFFIIRNTSELLSDFVFHEGPIEDSAFLGLNYKNNPGLLKIYKLYND